MDIETDDCVIVSSVYCGEHGSPSHYTLKLNYGAVLVPMCQTCIDELYEVILPHVSAEIRDKND